MTISFPIPVDIRQTVFGSVLASMHHRPELAGALRDRLPMMIPGGDPESLAAPLQEHLYHSTLSDLLGARRKLGAEMYAATWFVVGFHGWLAIAELEELVGPPWLPAMDHARILRDALFELGIHTDPESIRQTLRASPAPDGDDRLKNIDDRLLYFSEHVQYLSSAAIRNGHRTGLHAPAASAFISYAHEDAKFVKGLAGFLEKHAVNVWLDSDDLRSAARLDGRLRAGIERQDVFVPILSEASLRSRWVALELAAALELGRKILPVSLVAAADIETLRSHEGGDELYEGLMAFPVIETEGDGSLGLWRRVLRNLQKTELDLTRWRQDEGSSIAAFLGSVRGPS